MSPVTTASERTAAPEVKGSPNHSAEKQRLASRTGNGTSGRWLTDPQLSGQQQSSPRQDWMPSQAAAAARSTIISRAGPSSDRNSAAAGASSTRSTSVPGDGIRAGLGVALQGPDGGVPGPGQPVLMPSRAAGLLIGIPGRGLLALPGEVEHGGPDVADGAVDLVGRGCYPVPGWAFGDDAPRAVQAESYREEPVHDVRREPGHSVVS